MKKRRPIDVPSLYDSAIAEAFSPDAKLNEVTQIVVALGRALHQVGQPAHKVERTLVRVAERFHVPLEVFVVPTGQFLSFHREQGPVTFVLRINPGPVALDRLSRLMSVADRLVDGSLAPLAAKAHLDQIAQEEKPRSSLTTASYYVLSAAPFSIFFGGGWTELIVSTCVGLTVGLIAAIMARFGRSGRPFELVAAAAAAFIAGSADEILGAYGGWIPLAAGLIVLLPGIALVDSLEELANGQLTAGASRLAGVGVVFLALTFGSIVGYSAAEMWPKVHSVEAVHLQEWFILPALLVVAVGSTLRFRARFSDVWLILGASTLALVGTRLGTAYIGHLAGPFLAAAMLGVVGNLYARYSRRAAELLIVPGIALLVPGSVGARSLECLLSQDTAMLGVADAFDMFLLGIALVAGLLFSNSLVGERR
ncbi:MAG TPA: threonine/serine exporter family protein [Pirellulales bacterium]|jgi:uncharacterized membrane protein YjjP (DUF1212 family)